MTVDTGALVTVIGANQDFSKVTHIIDEDGLAVVLKNNKPRYIVVDFKEYEAIGEIRETREKELEMTADTLIGENMEAFLELAK